MIGDQFFQNKIISEQLTTITKNSFLLSQSETNTNTEIKSLLDNAAAEYARLGLTANKPLTQAQINSLQSDIIWFETETINGQIYIAPKIYLSQATRDNLKNNSLAVGSTIFAGRDLTINSSTANLTNSGSIISNGNMSINVASLTNKTENFLQKIDGVNLGQAQIKSGNNLSIAATNDIKNIGANINSVGNLTLISTAGNILNTAIVRTNDADLLNSNSDSYVAGGNVGDTRRINSILLSDASISGGSVSINAANDFTNLAADITTSQNALSGGGTSSGSLSITAGDDITIGTLQLHNHTETSWGNKKKGGTTITDTVENIGSNITAAGNVSLYATGLANLSGQDNESTAAYNQALNKYNADLVKYNSDLQNYNQALANYNSSSGKFGHGNATAPVLPTAPIQPNQSDFSASSDINIIGSNLTALGSGSLTADMGNVNIMNAVDSKMSDVTAKKSGFMSSRLDEVYDYKETAVESKLNFGGDLAINADVGTLNLIGSTLATQGNLNIGNFTVAQDSSGNFITNPDGTFQTVSGGSILGVNIRAAELRSEHSETHKQSKMNLGNSLKLLYDPVAQTKLANSAAKFAVVGGKLEIDSPKFKKTASKSGVKNITQYSSTLNVGGNLTLNSLGDVNISASDVNVGGNALLNIDGNLNITSAAQTLNSASKLHTLVIGTTKVSEDISHATISASVSGTGTGFEDSLTQQTQKSSNVNIGGSLFANVTNSLSAPTAGNLTIAASNLTVGGDSIIKTANSFNLTDAGDTSSYSSKASSLTVEVGAKIGNAYVDAGYAWKAVLDAQKQALKAMQKLRKMEKLRENGEASSKAVALASAQVVLAQVAVATALIAAAAASAGAATAASSSFGTGMYIAGFANITSSGVKNTQESSLSHASNFIGYGDINITSNNDLNVLGSMLASVNGNVTLSAVNDIKIEAGTNTLTDKSKQETIYGGGSVGNNGVQVNIGMSKGESEYTKTFYTNSGIFAENGTLTLNTGNDVNISGANLLAKNMILNVGNNLNVESKQTEEDFSSSGFGFSFGVGRGAGGNGNSVSGSVNMSSGDMHRMWVDDITTLKGTDSMTINTGTKSGSTGDLNLTGAAILSDNMTLNIKGNTNKKDLQDTYYSESMSIGVSRTSPVGNGNQPTVPGTGGQPNSFPQGQTTIQGSYSNNNSKRTTFATIGGLNSTLTSSTRNMNNGDFQGSLTVDDRLFSEEGRANIRNNLNLSSDIWFGTNLSRPKVTESGRTSNDAVPGTLPWFSRVGNENNTVTTKEKQSDGTYITLQTDYPAPNLLPAFWNDPNMGISDSGCKANSGCYYLASDEAPVLVLAHGLPGSDSGSAFHDAGKYPNNPVITAITIPPYFIFNYIGAIGTFFDVPNWNKNFIDPKTNIFMKPLPQPVTR